MADIFISYKREDQENKGRILPIVRALQAEGFDVFYDVEIPPGSTWEQVLQTKINMAKCVLVMWSEASVASDWVKEEAEIAKNAGKIIPVFLDPVGAPFGFSRIEGANLVGWAGDLDNKEWQNLITAIKSRVGEGGGVKQPEVKSVPMPVEKPARKKGGIGGLLIAGVLVALLGGGGYYGYSVLQNSGGSQVKPKPTPTPTRMPGVTPKPTPTATPTRVLTPVPMPTVRPVLSVSEDCIRYSGSYQVQTAVNGAKLVDAAGRGTPVYATGSGAEAEVKQAQRVAQHYRLMSQCFVERPKAEFRYWKTPDGGIPGGAMRGEDCIRMNPAALTVSERDGKYLVLSGTSSMLAFSDKAEAEKAVKIIRYYGATRMCYVGRPNASMSYIRK